MYGVVVLVAPYYKRFARNPQLHAFVRGVTAAATGAIAGAVVVLGRRAVHDLPTALIAGLTLLSLLKWKIPEPVLISVSAILGLVWYSRCNGNSHKRTRGRHRAVRHTFLVRQFRRFHAEFLLAVRKQQCPASPQSKHVPRYA